MSKKLDEQIIKDVAKNYHKLLRKNNFFPNYNQELEFYDSIASACITHYEWEGFIKNIEAAYFKLPAHLRKIIKHEYFYNNYTFWWEEYFSRKQYQTFKKEAKDQFISYLKEMNVITAIGDINVPTV